jgi:flagellar hook-length control protein FliK
MQVSAILVAVPLVPVETSLGPPAVDGVWAALAATLTEAMPEAAGPKAEGPEMEVEIDETTPPDLPIIQTIPAPPTVKSVEIPAAAPDLQPPDTAPIKLAQGPAIPLPMTPMPERADPPATPPAARPVDSPDPVVQIALQPSVAPPARRSKAENLWEMQGLIVPSAAPTEAEIATEKMTIAPASPPPTLPNGQTVPDAPPDPPPFGDPPALMDIAADPPEPHAPFGRDPVPLLQATPQADPSPAPRLSPEFRALVLAQATQPSDTGISVTLAPVELGELQLLLIPEGDALRVTITAERPETLDLLRRHADQLGQELRQAGFQSASFSFAQSGQGDRNAPTPLAHSDPQSAPLAPAEPPPLPIPAAPLAAGGLDLRI